jgi:L-iditol 2-dehydrogenase
MKAAFLLGERSIELRDVPVPEPAPGEVLVRVETALTCGTDVKTFLRGHAKLPVPAPLGHEFAGVVAAVGSGVTEFGPGDAVASVPTAPCGACRLCRDGRENLCPGAVGRMVLGGFAEYVLLPRHIVGVHLFRRPPSMGVEAAAALEPLACVVHGADRVESRRGWSRVRRVAVLGDGAIALLFARVAALRGAAGVLVLGRHGPRLAAARLYDVETAHVTSDETARDRVEEWTEGAGADLVIECVGTPDAWRLASELAATGGTVLFFGGCAAGTHASVDTYRVHYREVDLIGSFHYTPSAVRQALQLLSGGEVDVAPLVTHRLPLDRIHDAMALVVERTAIKVAVQP